MSSSSMLKKSIYVLLTFFTAACGSSSGSSGILFEGTLTEGAGVIHSSSHHLPSPRFSLKHAAGELIEEVEVCALGKCSITNLNGEWGFFVAEVSHSPVTFSINGHGIHTDVPVEIGEVVNHVFIHFEHNEGAVKVHHMTIDHHHSNGQHDHHHGFHDGHSDDNRHHNHHH